ncbi:hypothetical protein Tco_0189407 [Tanacetum coccineum]
MTCKKFWLLLQSTSRNSTKPTNNNTEIPQAQNTKNVDTTQAEKKGVSTSSRAISWLETRMKRLMNKSWKHIYSYMAKIQEVPNADSGTDSEPLEQDDLNDVECDDERVALAKLIANLKLDVDENKKIQKQLKNQMATLTQEFNCECPKILFLRITSRSLGESNSIRGLVA